MTQTILISLAHPDDEAFGCGGTIAKYSAAVARVVLVCATRGEEGEISSPDLATPENLGAVREQELRCAATALGLSDLIFLDFRDSGMAGTPANENPNAFVQQPADKVVQRLVQIIRDLRPATIITFEPHGGYGHPDHRAIHHHTTAARSAAAAPTYEPDLGAPWWTPQLLWSVIPQRTFRLMREAMAESDADTSDMEEVAERIIGWPDEHIDFEVDVSKYTDAKWQALLCHATQFGDNAMFQRVGPDLRQQLLGREYFVYAPGTDRAASDKQGALSGEAQG